MGHPGKEGFSPHDGNTQVLVVFLFSSLIHYLVAIQTEEIKEILQREPGRRLLTCMALVQPISAKELKHFPHLCFEIFKPGKSLDNRKRNFPNVSNYNKNDIVLTQFRPLFTNAELYVKNRSVIQKAIDCNLIKEIPSSLGRMRNNYYFLNSDIVIRCSRSGLQIEEEKKSFFHNITYNVSINKKNERVHKEAGKEFIALPFPNTSVAEQNPLGISHDFNSLPLLMSLFKWFIENPDFLAELMDKFNANSDYFIQRKELLQWAIEDRHKIYAALRDGILYSYSQDKTKIGGPGLNLAGGTVSFRFARSYNIFQCFSNYEHYTALIKKKTPMEFLDLLTSENYSIKPNNRSFIFTSLMYNFGNIDYSSFVPVTPNKTSKNYYDKWVKKIKSQYKDIERPVIRLNKQLVEDAIFNLRGSIGKFICKDKNSYSPNENRYPLIDHFPALDDYGVIKN